MEHSLVKGSQHVEIAAAISRYWHRNVFGRVAGRLYIAWCLAAVSLPILAGWLYDRTGSLWPCVFAHLLNNFLAGLFW